MPRCVALLRAINVGGRAVRMEELRRIFEQTGLERVDTFQAAGNVIFVSRARNDTALAGRIERHLRERLGYEVPAFLRTDREVAAIAAAPPFSGAEMRSARTLNVGLLRQPRTAAQIATLAELETGVDELRAVGCEIWWLCRVRQGESGLSNVRMERAPGVEATFRGHGTLGRLAARYPPAG